VLPAGRARDGLPVGLQVIGPFLADRTVMDVAGYIGELVGGFVSPPGY
jgi:amidase